LSISQEVYEIAQLLALSRTIIIQIRSSTLFHWLLFPFIGTKTFSHQISEEQASRWQADLWKFWLFSDVAPHLVWLFL